MEELQTSKTKQKLPLILILMVTLLCTGMITAAAAERSSQTARVSMNIQNQTLKETFKIIEKETGYFFFYNESDLNRQHRVNLYVRGESIESVLNRLLQNTNLNYKIVNQYVVIGNRVGKRKSVPVEERMMQTQQKSKITGTIRNEKGEPVAGVSILIKGSVVGTASNVDGKYSIEFPASSKTLVFSFIGMISQEIKVTGTQVLDIVMKDETKGLNEVVVVGYGTQKRASLVSAIQSVETKDLKGPTSNLTTMLAGEIAGLISYQRSGEPGKDNAQFFIRGLGTFGAGKVDPLILIDGVESTSDDLARLQPDDISGFSVLKDATASAVYGAKGANGVILVTTKLGTEGTTRFNARVENSISANTENFKFANNITYMNLADEAALTRDPLAALPYSQTKIDHTAAGDNPWLYPSNDWIQQMIKNYTMNQRYNINISGGTKKAQYYVAGTFDVDNGVLKENDLNNFNNNIKLRNYSVRSNVTLQMTPTTQAIVRVYGQFSDYHGPVGGGSAIFNAAMNANPVMFPAVYPSNMMPYATHPLFGNAVIGGTQTLYNNPYAESVSGYQEYNKSTMQAQLELKQKLDFITPGLSARLMTYTDRYAYFDVNRQYNPFYYIASSSNGKDIDQLTCLNSGNLGSIGTTGTEYLNYNEGSKIVNTTSYLETAANYERTFNKVHAVSGMLIGIIKNYLSGNAGDLQSSLPYRNAGLSGRFTYGYDNRYLLEYDFGCNGSERFAKNHRWGYFPSVGGGWVVSNESFFQPLKNTIDNLKLRATYGLVGNDQIGSSTDRFFYLSNVNMTDWYKGAQFGEKYDYTRPGISISRYANDLIGWEKSKQLDLGIDLSLFGSLNFIGDVFKQDRSDILMARSYIPSTMGLQAAVSANSGKAQSKGVDLSLDYHKAFESGWWLQGKGNFTYAHSKILVYDEPIYSSNEYYRSHVGYPTTQVWGYIAERLFVDDAEVANSPKQNFGECKGGDIKYRDVNGDGQITSADMVPIGHPTTPEINYGFGWTIGHRTIDFSAFFQGSARSSIFIDPSKISPFVISGGNQNELLRSIANSYWSESSRNLYAFWPRLSDYLISNNDQVSSWWMRNGAFLRLKTVEFGYNIPQSALKRLGLRNARLYVNGTNLCVWSKFKMWDPEMGGDGLGYPLQRVFNIGINVGI